MINQIATLGVVIQTDQAKAAIAEFGKLTKAGAALEAQIKKVGAAAAAANSQIAKMGGGVAATAAGMAAMKRQITPAAQAADLFAAQSQKAEKQTRRLATEVLTVGAATRQMAAGMGASRTGVRAFGHVIQSIGGAAAQMGMSMQSAGGKVRAFNEILSVGAATRGTSAGLTDIGRRVRVFGASVSTMGAATMGMGTAAADAGKRIRAFGDDMKVVGAATRQTGASMHHTGRRMIQFGESVLTVGAATSGAAARMGDVNREIRQMGGAMSEAAVMADHTRRTLFRSREGAIAVGAAAAEMGASMAHSTRQVRAFGEAFSVAGGATAGFGSAADRGRARMHLLADGMNRGVSAIGQFGTMSRRAEREFSEFTKKSTSHADGFMGVVLRLAAVFGGIQLSLAGLRTIANFEDIRDSFTSLNQGNAAIGEAQFAFARRYARQSPQTLEEVASAIVGLQNNNINPSESLLRLFSDVASVTSDQRGVFAQAVKLWQRGQQGGLGVEELDILSNRGVDVYGAIHRRLGLTRREVGDMGQDAAGSLRIVKALEAEWRGLYGGASLRRVDNLSVKWNAFMDTMKEAADNVGKGLSKTLHTALDKTSDFIQRNTAAFESLGAAIGTVVGGFSQLMTLASAFNRLTFNLPLYGLGAIMALFATSGIMKVLRLISPIGFIGRSSKALFSASQNTFRGARELYAGRHAYAGYTMLGLEGALAATTAADLASSRRSALQGIAADERVDPNINRRISRNLSAANKFGLVIGSILTSYRRLIPLVGKATALIATPFGAATAAVGGAIGLAVVKVSEDMKALNENVIGSKDTPESLIGRSFTFGEVWRAHVGLIKDDLVGAFQDLGWAIDDAMGNIPSSFWSWLNGSGRTDKERARIVAEGYGMGYTQEDIFNQYGSGPWDPRFDPLNAPRPSRVRRLGQPQERIFTDLSQSPKFWENQSLSNAGSVLQGGQEPQIAVVGARYAKWENAEIEKGKRLAEKFREQQFDYYYGSGDGPEDAMARFEERIESAMGSGFRSLGSKGTEAAHDFFDELGKELAADVLEYHIGEPFRDLLSNVMGEIYEALTSKDWWTKGPIGDLTSAVSGWWSTGTVDGIPTAHGGGYTGRMSGPGIDGKGGRPWILNNDEYIVPGNVMRSGGGKGGGNVTVNVYGAENADQVSAVRSTGMDGEVIDVFLNAAAEDIAGDGLLGKTIRTVHGLDRVAHS